MDEALKSLMQAHAAPEADVRLAVGYLRHYGYARPRLLSDPATADLEFAVSLLDAQEYLGLPATGMLDDNTLAMMCRPRCGCPDVQALGAMPARWMRSRITWTVKNYLPTLPASVQDGVFDTVFGRKDAWAQHIAVEFVRVLSGPADITIFCSPIDGPGNILAQAYLATGRDNPLTLQIDSSEAKWGLVVGSKEANLLGTVMHEVGHNLGAGHLGDQNSLMYAYANSRIVAPQKADIALMQRLGYQLGAAPSPNPSPVPPSATPTGGLMPELRKHAHTVLDWLMGQAKSLAATTPTPLDDIGLNIVDRFDNTLLDVLLDRLMPGFQQLPEEVRVAMQALAAHRE